MPDIGTGGGMKLSVGIGLNLTGFEALSQITKELETLQQMALKTEQAFRQMGAALRQTMNVGTGEMSRAADRMERASRTTSRSSPIPLSPIMGTNDERFAARYENTDLDMRARQHARALQSSERAIQRESEARDRAWSAISGGIMGGIGISAAFEIANLARGAIHAASDLNTRLGALRMQGFSDQEIEKVHTEALATRVPGMGTSAKILLQQELGGEVGGLDKVSPEAMQRTALYAQQIHAMTGADTNQVIRDLTKGATAIGGFAGKNGELDVNKFVGNEQMLAQGVLAGRGNVTIEQLRHNYQMASQFLSSQGVQFNKQMQAQMIVLTEKYGEQGGVLFNSMMSDVVRGTATRSPQARSLLFASGGMSAQRKIAIDPQTMKPVTMMQDSLNIQNGDYLGFFAQERERQRALMTRTEGHPPSEGDLTRRMSIVLPNFRSGRGQEALMSDTGREQVAKTMQALDRLPTSLEKSQANMLLFSIALQDVQEQAKSAAGELMGPFTQDAIKVLLQIGSALQGIAQFAHEHEGFVRFATDVAETIAGLVALRLAIAALGKTAWLLGMGGRGKAGAMAVAEGAAMGAAARPGLAGVVGKTEAGVSGGLLEGAVLGGAMTGLKSKMGTMAGRSMTALIVGGLAEAIIDGLSDENQITTIAKQAIQGAEIGGAVAGVMGAVVGAIADPLLRFANSHSIVKPPEQFPGLTPEQSIEQNRLDEIVRQSDDFLNRRKPAEANSDSGFSFSDPFGVLARGDALLKQRREEAANQPPKAAEIPPMPFGARGGERPLLSYLPGFSELYEKAQQARDEEANEVVRHRKQMALSQSPLAQKEEDDRERNRFNFMHGLVAPEASNATAAHRRSWEHRATVGRLQTDIPLPGAAYPPPGMTPYEFYRSGAGRSAAPGMHPALSPSAAQTPAAASAGLSAETTSALTQTPMSDIPKIGTSTITADRLVVGTVSGMGGENKTPTAGKSDGGSSIPSTGTTPNPPHIGSSPAPPVAPLDMMSPYTPMSGSNVFRPSDVRPMSGNTLPATRQGTGTSPTTTLGFHGKGIQRFPIEEPSKPSIFGDANPFTNLPPGLQQSPPGTHVPMALGGSPQSQSTSNRGWRHTPGMGHGPVAPAVAGATGSLAKTIGLSGQQYDAFRNSIAKIESGGKYDIMGGSSGRFAGRYQMGQTEIAETAQHLGVPVPSREQFLKNPAMQEKFFEQYTLDHNSALMKDPNYAGLSATQKAEVLGYAHNQGAGGAMEWLDKGKIGRDAFGTAGTAYSTAIGQALAAPNIQGPQVNPEQADVPASTMHVTINSAHHLDGEQIASTVAEHFIGGGPTALPSATAYDSKAMPLVPGASVPRW